ncbi:Rrp15p-domain-containing protein [Ascobolus immersus RN42]|uniref:Rrp15p-domain-containing protein n=1 Tax=Ascobolus immersus RN42 TaxID=1160509 RepID=A0A3N4IKT2_ASCIM|nr:Rrp15p-domain-containing protein [Ascobolus immersus RN42]
MGMPASKKRKTEPSKSKISALTDVPSTARKSKGKVTISSSKVDKSIKPTQSKKPEPQSDNESEAAGSDAYEDPVDSDSDDEVVEKLDALDTDDAEPTEAAESDAEADEEGDSDSDYNTMQSKKRKRRTDPALFSTSLSKILSSHLTTAARSDPILIRARTSKTAEATTNAARVEAKAKRLLVLEKKKSLEKGRIRNLLPVNNTAEDDDTGDNGAESMQAIMEREKRLRKIAQRGVVRLFNAVRAAQVKGEMAEKVLEADVDDAARIVSLGEKKEKVTEMSKKGFLDLLEKGGK